MQIIIFPQDDNKVSAIYPAPDYANQIEAVAAKDVPEGKPWRIVDESELPDRESRNRWRWTETGTLTVVADVPVVPESITFAQLLIGLVTEAWITEADGEAWLSGTLPDPVLALIATLPVEQRFAAKARAIAPSEVLRADPLVQALGTAQGKTSEELDEFFRTYAQV